eukprot:4007212-Amphidinium_carterae.2
MANVEALAAQLNALQAELRQRHQRMQLVEAESARLRADGLGALPQLIQVLQSQARDRLVASLVDVKCIGKPATFSGKEDEWRELSVKFESFGVGVYGKDMGGRPRGARKEKQQAKTRRASRNQEAATASPAPLWQLWAEQRPKTSFAITVVAKARRKLIGGEQVAAPATTRARAKDRQLEQWMVPSCEEPASAGPTDIGAASYRTASGKILEDQGSALIPGKGDNAVSVACAGSISAASTLKSRVAIMDEHGGVIMRLDTAEGKQVQELINRAWNADMKRRESFRPLIPLVHVKGVYNILVGTPNSTDASTNEIESGGGQSGGAPVYASSILTECPGAAASLRRKAGRGHVGCSTRH